MLSMDDTCDATELAYGPRCSLRLGPGCGGGGVSGGGGGSGGDGGGNGGDGGGIGGEGSGAGLGEGIGLGEVFKMTSKQEEQLVKILLAQQENPTFSHAKVAKLQDAAKSTVTNVLKVFGERLSTARKLRHS
ncbi:uncharacterized protein ZMO1243-like [Ochlerotatus camptorhynchus]|uniref:uncharacterized protein ZMO1243-like n=1 Tax=Ochlerotatus camptorhynchus TaxID=644619 RepID=UPI0031D4F01B